MTANNLKEEFISWMAREMKWPRAYLEQVWDVDMFRNSYAQTAWLGYNARQTEMDDLAKRLHKAEKSLQESGFVDLGGTRWALSQDAVLARVYDRMRSYEMQMQTQIRHLQRQVDTLETRLIS